MKSKESQRDKLGIGLFKQNREDFVFFEELEQMNEKMDRPMAEIGDYKI